MRSRGKPGHHHPDAAVRFAADFDLGKHEMIDAIRQQLAGGAWRCANGCVTARADLFR